MLREPVDTLRPHVSPCTGALARVQVSGKWHNVPRKQATYATLADLHLFRPHSVPKALDPLPERVRIVFLW